MIPFVVLISIFFILFVINKVAYQSKWSYTIIGRISMAMMLAFTGLSHFVNTSQMKEMIPDFLPVKEIIIYLTGILELVLATGLVTRKWSKFAALILIIFFIAVIPSNVIGTMKHLNFGGMQYGPDYLYFRIPAQLVFIGWAYFFGIRINRSATLFPF